jgi:hypothetical protein
MAMTDAMQTGSSFAFGTKAETLNNLTGRIESATIGELLYFPCEQWLSEPDAVLDDIRYASGRRKVECAIGGRGHFVDGRRLPQHPGC